MRTEVYSTRRKGEMKEGGREAINRMIKLGSKSKMDESGRKIVDWEVETKSKG